MPIVPTVPVGMFTLLASGLILTESRHEQPVTVNVITSNNTSRISELLRAGDRATAVNSVSLNLSLTQNPPILSLGPVWGPFIPVPLFSWPRHVGDTEPLRFFAGFVWRV